MRVAPLVGVWIEIFFVKPDGEVIPVAPLVGVWIEMNKAVNIEKEARVAPLVGVWIEIAIESLLNIVHERRSPRGSVD